MTTKYNSYQVLGARTNLHHDAAAACASAAGSVEGLKMGAIIDPLFVGSRGSGLDNLPTA